MDRRSAWNVLKAWHRLVLEGGSGSGHHGHAGGTGGPGNPGGSISDSMTADKVASILSEQPFNKGKSKDKLKEKWISSSEFHLMDIPVGSVGIATTPTGVSKSTEPIIVDENVNQVGRLASEFGTHGAAPDILVLDGKHRLVQAISSGKKMIKAYVGDKVIPMMKQKIKEFEGKEKEKEIAISAYLSNPNGSTLRALRSVLPEDEVAKIRASRKVKQ